MPAEECHDRLRFRLSDDSGVLRFEEFAIVDGPDCGDMQRALREYLVGRSLAHVDLDYLRGLNCSGDGECLLGAVIREVEKCQHLFSGKDEREPTIQKRALI